MAAGGEVPSTITIKYAANANGIDLKDAEVKTCEVEVKALNDSTTEK